MGARLPGDPRRVAGFRLLGRLGAVALGVVHLAEHPRLGAAALRLVHVAGPAEHRFRDRLRREADVAMALRGPRVARVLAADPEADVPWLATRFVDGPTLAEAVARQPLSNDGLVALALAVADAVATLHDAGAVHGRLTPSNVLLTAETPVVTDLGIGWAQLRSTLPAPGVRPDRSDGAPPELLAGEQPGPASDVYAWGRLVAFAAQPPLPEPLVELVPAALQVEPDQRPSIHSVVATLLADAEPASPTEVASLLVARGWSATTLPDPPRAAAPEAAAEAPTEKSTEETTEPRPELGPEPTAASQRDSPALTAEVAATPPATAAKVGPGGLAVRGGIVYGIGGNVVLALVPVAVLVGYLRFVDTFRDRVILFLTFSTEESTLGYDGPRTFANVDQFTPWIPRVLLTFAAVAVAGGVLRRLLVTPLAIRAYALCSALVEAALGAALVVPVGFVSLVYETAQATSPEGRHPGAVTLGDGESMTTWTVVEVVSIVVACLGVALVLASVYRLGTALLGGRVARPDGTR